MRVGVEEMLDEQGGAEDAGAAQRELDELRIETRHYVKRKSASARRSSSARCASSTTRTDKLERRIDQVEADRE